MKGMSAGRCVLVYVGESDQVGHTPRYQAMLEYLRREGAAGATVTRGVAGFGVNSRVHTASILSLSVDLPMVLTWVDSPARVRRLLPGLIDLAGSGIVTVEDVHVASYGGRRVEQLRFDVPVRDAMTIDVLAAAPSMPLREAVELLADRGLRTLPVIDQDGRLVGMVNEADLVEHGGLEARLELLAALSADARARVLARLDPARTLAQVMVERPATVSARDTLARATHLMATGGLPRLAVVDDDGRLVGLLSRADVLRAAAETFPRESVAALDLAGARTVGEMMRDDAPIVAADADLAEVVEAVTSSDLERAVIIDAERRVVGIVSDADLLRSVDPAAGAGLLGSLMGRPGRAPRADSSAASLATREALTAGPGMGLADAARLMVEGARRLLCVVDADGRLLGIVDRADLLRALGEAVAPLVDLPVTDDDEG